MGLGDDDLILEERRSGVYNEVFEGGWQQRITSTDYGLRITDQGLFDRFALSD